MGILGRRRIDTAPLDQAELYLAPPIALPLRSPRRAASVAQTETQ